MATVDLHFLKHYSYFTYVYIVSKLEKYNKNMIDKYDVISPVLYQGKPDFDNSLISQIMEDNYLDYNQLQCISMMIEYMLYWTTKNVSVSNSNKRYEFLNYFMNNVHQVLPNMIHKNFESVHGYVVFSDFIKIKNKLVIKTPKDDDEIRNMLFEYYIGSKFINKLRNKTPNFMYTYGIFMCNPLIKIKKVSGKEDIKINVAFCNDNNKNNIYVLFEKIDGTTLHDYIQQIKTEQGFDDVINSVIQIMLSLDIAQKEGQYSHNDLHTDNVMLRNIDNPLTYDYLIGKSKYTMNMNYIATIIDYGMNRFVEDNIPLGVTVSERFELLPYKNTTASDIFKFLVSSIFSVIVLIKKTPNVYNSMKNKIDDTIEFLISFFRGRYKHDMLTHWDEYLLNKTESNFTKFMNTIFTMKKNYYYPFHSTSDHLFYNTVIPSNFIIHVKDTMPTIWNSHVKETIIYDKDMMKSYTRVFDPEFDEEEYEDYELSQSFNSIYFSDFVKQKKTLYNLFNKQFKKKFEKDCLVDQESMIMNFNNILDCKAIVSIYDNNKKEMDMINEFELENINNIKNNYENDVSTLVQYMNELDTIYASIDNNLFNLYRDPNYVKISMTILNEEMKKQIKKMYQYLKIYDKYLLLTTFSLDLKDIAKQHLPKYKFGFSLFEPKMKYFDIAMKISDCIRKYYSVLYEYYSVRMTEESKKTSTNVYTFWNLNIIMQNMNPHYHKIYDIYAKCFLNQKIKMKTVPNLHYVPVNSNNQFKMYLSLKSISTQLQPLVHLVTRYINYDNALKGKLTMSTTKSLTGDDKYDIDIYDYLRSIRKPIDPSKKNRRNVKRAGELYDYLHDILVTKMGKVLGGDTYYHLDYGGNDGSVASEFAKILKVDKSQVYSADVESWLGNKKNNLHDNITYTMLSENQKLPYRTNSFDSVSCLQVLHHIEYIDAHINELNRILKPGGLLVIKEHDCHNESTQFLIDIEHMIHEYVVQDEQNTKILNTYVAFYKSFHDLNTILINSGFEFVSDDYNFDPKINPTRYYFAIYKKK